MRKKRFAKDFPENSPGEELSSYMKYCSQMNTVKTPKQMSMNDPWGDWFNYPLVNWPENYKKNMYKTGEYLNPFGNYDYPWDYYQGKPVWPMTGYGQEKAWIQDDKQTESEPGSELKDGLAEAKPKHKEGKDNKVEATQPVGCPEEREPIFAAVPNFTHSNVQQENTGEKARIDTKGETLLNPEHLSAQGGDGVRHSSEKTDLTVGQKGREGRETEENRGALPVVRTEEKEEHLGVKTKATADKVIVWKNFPK